MKQLYSSEVIIDMTWDLALSIACGLFRECKAWCSLPYMAL